MCDHWQAIGHIASDLVGTIRLGSQSADDPHADIRSPHLVWVVVAATGVGRNGGGLIAAARGRGIDRSEWIRKASGVVPASFTATREKGCGS